MKEAQIHGPDGMFFEFVLNTPGTGTCFPMINIAGSGFYLVNETNLHKFFHQSKKTWT